MASFLVLNWVHLVAAVILGGYVLFWLVMAVAVRDESAALPAADETLSLIGRSRWPPVVVPKAVRLPLFGLGWALVVFMAASGAVLLRARGIGSAQLASAAFWHERMGLAIGTKAILLVALAVTHARFARHPSPRAAVLGAILVVVIVCASALL